mmetsp:Transcript_51288/g.100717  ORF Transcript_51288/g.100717 Transcript_51288/m.100717 type:complete len:81 (+) Transcript_51288:453-695(+)
MTGKEKEKENEEDLVEIARVLAPGEERGLMIGTSGRVVRGEWETVRGARIWIYPIMTHARRDGRGMTGREERGKGMGESS